MGLFDSDDVTSVYVNNIQLMPDPPDFKKKIMLQAILSGQGIAESIMVAKPRIGVGLAKSVRQYAKTRFNYSLPSFRYSVGSSVSSDKPVTDPAALTQIKWALGDPSAITLVSAVYGPADDLDFVTKFKLSKSGWSPEYSPYYNNFASQVAYTRLKPSSPDTYFMWSNATFDTTDPTVQAFTYRLHYGFNPYGGVPPIGYELFSNEYDEFHQYDKAKLGDQPYIVKVSYKDTNSSEPNRTRYWYYYPSTNQYPTINNAIYGVATGEFLPIIPVRENFAFLPSTSTLGNQSRQLLKKIGMTFSSIEEALINSGSIGEIRDAYVSFELDIKTEDSGLWPYLFEFFSKYAVSSISPIYFNADGTFKNPEIASLYYASKETNYVTGSTISFAWQESNYGHAVFVSRIFIIKSGTASGSVSTYSRELIIRPVMQYQPVTITSAGTDESCIKFIKRTGGLTETVLVFGVSCNNRIGSHSTPLSYLRHSAPMPILMDLTVLARCPVNVRDTVVYKSMSLSINGYRVTHLKWYETGDFLSFVRIVGIAITVFTLGTSTGLTAAIKAGLEATLLYIGETAVTIALVSLAGKQIASWLGPEAAMAFAVIATVYGIANMGAGEISLPGAELALALVPAVQTGMQAELMKAFEELQFEADAMLKSNKDRMEELERAQSLLSDKGSLDPLFLIRAIPLIFTNESPTEFINRTIHNTNPGTSTLESIRGYCRNQLTLPKAETV